MTWTKFSNTFGPTNFTDDLLRFMLGGHLAVEGGKYLVGEENDRTTKLGPLSALSVVSANRLWPGHLRPKRYRMYMWCTSALA